MPSNTVQVNPKDKKQKNQTSLPRRYNQTEDDVVTLMDIIRKGGSSDETLESIKKLVDKNNDILLSQRSRTLNMNMDRNYNLAVVLGDEYNNFLDGIKQSTVKFITPVEYALMVAGLGTLKYIKEILENMSNQTIQEKKYIFKLQHTIDWKTPTSQVIKEPKKRPESAPLPQSNTNPNMHENPKKRPKTAPLPQPVTSSDTINTSQQKDDEIFKTIIELIELIINLECTLNSMKTNVTEINGTADIFITNLNTIIQKIDNLNNNDNIKRIIINYINAIETDKNEDNTIENVHDIVNYWTAYSHIFKSVIDRIVSYVKRIADSVRAEKKLEVQGLEDSIAAKQFNLDKDKNNVELQSSINDQKNKKTNLERLISQLKQRIDEYNKMKKQTKSYCMKRRRERQGFVRERHLIF